MRFYKEDRQHEKVLFKQGLNAFLHDGFQELKEQALSELSHLLGESVDEVTTIPHLLAKLKEFNAMEAPRAFIKEASKRPQGAFPISALYTERAQVVRLGQQELIQNLLERSICKVTEICS